jgi:anti-sigma factor RsiW
MECRDTGRFSQLLLDDEIDAGDALELDTHLASCAACRAEVHAESLRHEAIRARLREGQARVRAPADLAVRVRRDLAEVHAEARFPWGRAMAAAVGVGMVAVLSVGSISAPDTRLVEEAVTRHSRHLPPEARGESDEVQRFLRTNLRYPVAVPRFDRAGRPVRLVGARLSSIDDRDAAYMMYDHRGARLSVFAYPRPSTAEPRGLERREVGGRVVYVGRRNGYNVVNWHERDLEYSLVSDADPGELVQLVSHSAP